jgi:hypothetical protein
MIDAGTAVPDFIVKMLDQIGEGKVIGLEA